VRVCSKHISPRFEGANVRKDIPNTNTSHTGNSSCCVEIAKPCFRCGEFISDQAYVSDSTLAALLDTSRTTIWRYVRNGLLPPPVKIGGLTRFDRLEVLSFVKRQHANADVSGGAPAKPDEGEP
jgi:predicted DNA-binding transcriptional regulator AlpA